jgi:hypothetical protein
MTELEKLKAAADLAAADRDTAYDTAYDAAWDAADDDWDALMGEE